MTLSFCNLINGGFPALALDNVVVEANYGWYQGSAGYFNQTVYPSTTFYFNNVSGLPFRVSVTDAYCSGDRFLLDVTVPATSTTFQYLTDFTASFDLCSVFELDPNVAFTQNDFFSHFTIDSSLYSPNPLTGNWKIKGRSFYPCFPAEADPLPPFTGLVGYFLRIDQSSYTASICSFNRSIVEDFSTTSVANKIHLSPFTATASLSALESTALTPTPTGT